MPKMKNQMGVTLVEVAVTLAVMGLIIGPSLLILRDFFAIPTRASISVSLLQKTRQATGVIANDIRNATSFTPGTGADYGTFVWTDLTDTPSTDHVVRYFYSSEDKTLVREETINIQDPEATVVTRNIENQSDISIEEVSGLLTIPATSTIGASLSEPVTRTSVLKAHLRLLSPSTQPTPPPHRIAWDDFETGDFTGGDGWLDDWFPQGGVLIDLTGDPFEGTFHMRLEQSPASVDRSADLSDQVGVRLQFQAKVIGFEPLDTAQLLISTDGGTTFTTVRTWVDGEDDNIYRFEDIDLTLFPMTADFLIAFTTNISTNLGFLFVDDLKMIRTWSG